MEVIPAISMALFAGHIVDQRKKKVCFSNVFWGFQSLVWACFLFTWPPFIKDFTTQTILYSIYFFVFLGGSALFWVQPYFLFWP
jgi:hypothetical protein